MALWIVVSYVDTAFCFLKVFVARSDRFLIEKGSQIMSARIKITRNEHLPLPDRPSVIEKVHNEAREEQLIQAFAFEPEVTFEDDFSFTENLYDEQTPKKEEEQIRYVLAQGSLRSFIFHPSFVRVYYNLKQCSPEFAVEYIEALMNYGVYGTEIPDDPILKAVMDGIIETIEKAYTNFCLKKHIEAFNARHNLDAGGVSNE